MSIPRRFITDSLLAQLAKFARYASVSLIATATGLTVLGILVAVFHVDAVLANFLATAVGTVPSFELNRRWVWSHDAGERRARQIVPFCMLAFVGLVISSIAVHVASAATLSSDRFIHTGAVELANVGAYGALWLIQYFLCDRLLFASRSAPPAARTEHPLPADEEAPAPELAGSSVG